MVQDDQKVNSKKKEEKKRHSENEKEKDLEKSEKLKSEEKEKEKKIEKVEPVKRKSSNRIFDRFTKFSLGENIFSPKKETNLITKSDVFE